MDQRAFAACLHTSSVRFSATTCWRSVRRPTKKTFPPSLDWIGPGLHLLLHEGDTLVSHLMLVERQLQPEGYPLLRTGYVELVATRPARQGRGFASALLRAVTDDLEAFDLGALSPSDATFHERLGWESWRGALWVPSGRGVVMTDSRRLLQHFLAALAYRTQKALRGAPPHFADFRAGTNARTADAATSTPPPGATRSCRSWPRAPQSRHGCCW